MQCLWYNICGHSSEQAWENSGAVIMQWLSKGKCCQIEIDLESNCIEILISTEFGIFINPTLYTILKTNIMLLLSLW